MVLSENNLGDHLHISLSNIAWITPTIHQNISLVAKRNKTKAKELHLFYIINLLNIIKATFTSNI